MHEAIKKFPVSSNSDDSSIYPVFYNLAFALDKEKFLDLIQDKTITIYDRILLQIEELIKIRHPDKKLTQLEFDVKMAEHLQGKPAEEYGVWVYYPWSKKMIHILGEEEFVELRTNRNLNKITIKEREILSEKKIGVIGLSVGQSVALTLAMERSLGEIRIADFDTIDLSNLNRIRTAIHNVGISKTIVTAREISEIDPYLKVVCFSEGVTENNISQFLTDGGNLDILIDECDRVDIKILCREKSKSLKIAVVMEASDRGTIDIERFDLEPDRPIFHGKLSGLNYNTIKTMDPDQMKGLIPVVAQFETLSERMKLSIGEIGKTIVTWPQLASAVVLGGGVTADVCRRISLNQLKISGRFFIDLEELIFDTFPEL